jgi:LAO/AO transport system kinase
MADADLVDRVRAGERRAVARALTAVERRPGGPLSSALYRHAGRAHVVGVTGAPGSGKSTLVSAMTRVYRDSGRTVGVVAVDPSSPFTGGAVLGDRVRMGAHSGDAGVFIRSMAARGSVGGLSLATGDAVRVLDAAGFDVVIVETVGAGQAEVEIADEAHTTVVVVVPGLGDDIQAIKAGILEIADVFAVNKSDQPGADRAVAHLRMMLSIGMRGREVEWSPPVLQTIATTGQGVAELVAAVGEHGAFLRESGHWRERERLRATAELERLLHARLVADRLARAADGPLDALLDGLVMREISPQDAVAALLDERAEHAGQVRALAGG